MEAVVRIFGCRRHLRARISITWRYTAHGLLISVRDVLRQAMCFGSQSPDFLFFWRSLSCVTVCQVMEMHARRSPLSAENAHAVCHRLNTKASTLVWSTSLLKNVNQCQEMSSKRVKSIITFFVMKFWNHERNSTQALRKLMRCSHFQLKFFSKSIEWTFLRSN